MTGDVEKVEKERTRGRRGRRNEESAKEKGGEGTSRRMEEHSGGVGRRKGLGGLGR